MTSNTASTHPKSPRTPHKRAILIAILAIVILFLLLVIAYAAAHAGKIFVRRDWARKLGLPTATLACVRPTLTLGAVVFPLETVIRQADSGLPAPGEQPDSAWWVSDSFSPFILLLSPTVDSPDLQSNIKIGDPLVVQWADCGREEFVLSEVQPGAPDVQALLSQAAPGIVVIVQPQGDGEGYVLHGERPQPAPLETPEPIDPNAIQTDITFGESIISEDNKSLTTNLTITNVGNKPIHITPADISLAAEGKEPLNPLNVDPALPQEIQPGASLSLAITFPNPGGHIAMLKLLDLTVDLYFR